MEIPASNIAFLPVYGAGQARVTARTALAKTEITYTDNDGQEQVYYLVTDTVDRYLTQKEVDLAEANAQAEVDRIQALDKAAEVVAENALLAEIQAAK